MLPVCESLYTLVGPLIWKIHCNKLEQYIVMWLSLGLGATAWILAVIIILFNHNYVHMQTADVGMGRSHSLAIALVQNGHWFQLYFVK